MKKTGLLLLFAILQFSAFAQIGIFRSYEDYLNNRVIQYNGYHSTTHELGNFRVAFLDESGKRIWIRIKLRNMWGYRRGNGDVLRIDKKNNPNVIIVTGKICVYGNYSTELKYGMATMNKNQFAPSVSMGLNGEMKKFKRSTLKRFLEGDEVALAQLKKTRRNYNALMKFIQSYNSVHTE